MPPAHPGTAQSPRHRSPPPCGRLARRSSGLLSFWDASKAWAFISPSPIAPNEFPRGPCCRALVVLAPADRAGADRLTDGMVVGRRVDESIGERALDILCEQSGVVIQDCCKTFYLLIEPGD